MSAESMSEQIIYLVNLAVRLEAERDQLKAENAELRAGRGRWPEQPYSHAVLPDGRVVPYEEAKHIKDGAIPVTAETIRQSEPGSTWEDKDGDVWEWTGEELKHHLRDKDKGGCMDHGGFYRLGRSPSYLIENYGPITRSTAAPRGDYGTPPRLTVHKLNVAPVGSLLHLGTILKPTVQKVHSGKWVTAVDELMNTRVEWSAEDLIEYGWADATLRLPEAA